MCITIVTKGRQKIKPSYFAKPGNLRISQKLISNIIIA